MHNSLQDLCQDLDIAEHPLGGCIILGFRAHAVDSYGSVVQIIRHACAPKENYFSQRLIKNRPTISIISAGKTSNRNDKISARSDKLER